MTWDPKLYMAFQGERTRPAVDLAARIELNDPKRIVDLGCGPGNSSAVLRARWPHANITGLDNDAAMLTEAEQTDPSVRWIRGDATTWQPNENFDLVFSNAMLQWLPNHEEILPLWFRAVSPGGALAIQLPTHLQSPLHRHILEIAASTEWNEMMKDVHHAMVIHDAAFYYDILCSFSHKVDIWETEYCHVMENPEAIITWIRSTGLRPFLQALTNDTDKLRFESALLQRVEESYPRRRDGRVLFPFRRLFLIAYRQNH